MTQIQITPEMLKAGGREMQEVNDLLVVAAFHGFNLPVVDGQHSPLARAYRVMRKLEPVSY